MQLLGTTSALQAVNLPSSESTPDAESLRELAPTDVYQRRVESITNTLAALPDDSDTNLRRRGDLALRRAQWLLEQAQVRDDLQAARPEGCWCLGLGGKGVRYIPVLDGGDPIPVLDTYCVCPEAEARAAKDAVERAYYAATRQQHERAQRFIHAEIPVRFADVSFQSYPISAATRTAFAAIQQWAAEGQESLLIYGAYGTGKTGLGIAAMRQCVMNTAGLEALFLTTPSLLDHIRQTYNRDRSSDGPTESSILRQVQTTGLLMLDDLGAERPTDWVQEKLFSIINHRHDEMLPTIFTSNLDPEGLAQHLGERIAWRVVEMCQVVNLDGPNLRDRRPA